MMVREAAMGATVQNWGNAMKSKINSERRGEPATAERRMPRIPIVWGDGRPVCLSKSVCPLLSKTVHGFCSRWTPGGRLLHIEDGSGQRMHFDETLAKELGANADVQARMPDLVVYLEKMNRLVLVETIKCGGPISPERRSELGMMFRNS